MDHQETVCQLQSSGVQFSIKFIGSVPITMSVNVLSPDCQNALAMTCMKIVSNEIKRERSLEINESEISELISDAPPTIYDKTIDINISAKAILLVDCSGHPVLYRFDIHDISLVSPGKDDLRSCFCFFAKVTEDGDTTRHCFVFDAGHDDDMEEVHQTICYAFRISEEDAKTISANTSRRSSGSCLTPVQRPMSGCHIPNGEASMQDSPFLYQQHSTDRPPIIRIEPVRPAPPPPLGPSNVPPPELPPRSRRSLSSMKPSSSHEVEPVNTVVESKQTAELLHQHARKSSSSRDDRRARSTSTPRDMNVEVSDERYEEITENLSNFNWYHGLLTRIDAESRLRRDGEFLVRRSPNIPKQFVLSGNNNNQIKHICLVGHDGKIASKNRDFSSIVELVQFYRMERIPIISNGVVLRLDSPVEME
ncbi:SH2 domain-containing protein [Ditylenchus destructor]|nr:SH2 domain-containing protein [Ditylenchus destructor]